uniref:Uncharacterized protein n=1 Tax=Ditylum brightwellii TaxID=49249 RepID=A0A7S4R2B8_9STRA|mmetsp:Transcript_15325/g.20300  ORF Transcript_15325/g.20300 Transcript_15325/m.20300 type:complete len:531 (+) Transcript_15325:205-1797(+)
MMWDTTQLQNNNKTTLRKSSSTYASYTSEEIEQAFLMGRNKEKTDIDVILQNGYNNVASASAVIADDKNDSSNRNTTTHDDIMAMGRCPALDDDLIATTDTVQSLLLPKRKKETQRKNKPRRNCILDGQIVDRLMNEGFTLGLAHALVENSNLFALRIWLVDNSGSMSHTDGHRIVQSKSSPNKVNTVECTRWEEVASGVIWHAQLAAVLRAPIVFRLLNDPGKLIGSQQLSVAKSCFDERIQDNDTEQEQNIHYITDPTLLEQQSKTLEEEVQQVKRIMRQSRPLGSSPLSQHLRAVYTSILTLKHRIAANDKLIALTIATDGLPTDEEGNEDEHTNIEFVNVLKLFASLPVVIIVRLSTDEERVVNFYNELNSFLTTTTPTTRHDNNQLPPTTSPMNIDVLDDFISEAQEVYEHNPWLTYGLPLHLSREYALEHDILSILDDRLLQPSELRLVCQTLFGTSRFNEDVMPDPVVNYKEFSRVLKLIVDREQYQWNPIKKKSTPWIDFKVLDRIYGHNTVEDVNCTCVMQ